MNKKSFVAALVEKIKTADVPAYAKKSGPEVAAMLGSDPEVFIAGELTEPTGKRGGSKVGGKPDVGAGFSWPHEEDDEDAPLQFIAQLNLAEVKPHDFDNKLPAKGMVWIFSIADGDRAGGGEIDASTTKVLYSADPGPLKPHDIPEELAENEDATIEEQTIEFGPVVSTDGIRDSGVKDVVYEAAAELGGRNGPVYLLNTVDGADEPTFMLADLDMYRIAPNAFGEGILSFTLTQKDLAKGALGNADTVFNGGS